jgi:hypothetical protein
MAFLLLLEGGHHQLRYDSRSDDGETGAILARRSRPDADAETLGLAREWPPDRDEPSGAASIASRERARQWRDPGRGDRGHHSPGVLRVDLASAYAWRGQKAEAAAAVAELLKLRPGYTVQKLTQEGSGVSDHPTFRKEFQRIVEGVRKAGLPES